MVKSGRILALPFGLGASPAPTPTLAQPGPAWPTAPLSGRRWIYMRQQHKHPSELSHDAFRLQTRLMALRQSEAGV